MTVEPGPLDDRDRLPGGVEHNAVFREVEDQCAPGTARPVQRGERAVKRGQLVRREREGRLGIAVMRRLHRIVG